MNAPTATRLLLTAAAALAPAAGPARADDWVEEAKLTASDGAAYDHFGKSVSLSGDCAVVGAPKDDDNGDRSGSAYIFERGAGGAWGEVVKLTPSDGSGDDMFGRSVSLDGERALIGAYNDDDRSGSAYIFERGVNGTWGEAAKLTASDGTFWDEFGLGVSLSGDYAIVGARCDDDNGDLSGSAYIFERSAGGLWGEAAKLTASDGAAGDCFGLSVSLTGDYAIVGAHFDDDNGVNSGSAYIFERGPGGAWSEVAKVVPSDGEAGDCFGVSVSLAGDYAIVGAFGNDDYGYKSGSAYVFERGAGGTWSEVGNLTASDALASDYFGWSVAVSGECAIVGAYGNDDNGSDSGSAYIFERGAGGAWSEVGKLTASDGAKDDRFGDCVSISGDYAIAGAWGHGDSGPSCGSAYIFVPEPGAVGLLALGAWLGLLRRKSQPAPWHAQARRRRRRGDGVAGR